MLIVCAVPILSSFAMGELIPSYSGVNVGDLVFSFPNQEDTTNKDVIKFGQPASGGSGLLFPNFVMDSVSQQGSVSGGANNTQLTILITAQPGKNIQTLNLGEVGNFFLNSFNGGEPLPSASVSSLGSSLTILMQDNNPVSIPRPGERYQLFQPLGCQRLRLRPMGWQFNL